MPPTAAPVVVLWIAGVVLLVAGRRLYWLFVGVAGFVVGFALAERFLAVGPPWLDLLAALLVACAAALLTGLVKRLAIGAIGFLGGAALLAMTAEALAWELGPWLWLAALAAGVAGAVLTRALFEVGLVLLSSLVGAALVVEAAGWLDPTASILLLALATAGVAVQLLTRRRR